jgi:hypothetical protein
MIAEVPTSQITGSSALGNETDRIGAEPAFGRTVRGDPGRGVRRDHADQAARRGDLGIIGQHAGVPGVAGADHRDAGGRCLLDRDSTGAMRHDVAEVVAAIELRRHRRLMQDPDRTPAVAGARHPLGDADGAREAAVTEPTQFAIDQVVGDQAGIGGGVSKRRHDADHQLMRLLYIELHDQSRRSDRSAASPAQELQESKEANIIMAAAKQRNIYLILSTVRTGATE